MRQVANAIAIGSLVVSALLYGFVRYQSGEDRAQVPASALQTERGATPERIFGSALPARTPIPDARPTLGNGATRVRESKALEFEISSASGEPTKRFRAYELAHDCAIAHLLSESSRTETWLPGRPSEPFPSSECGDLKPGQWDHPELRHALLREASLAGVHGAWFRLWQEGPDGPLRTLADGPDYQAWEELARKAALASGDPFVYAREAQEWRDRDPYRALVATIVYRDALARRLPGATFDPSVDIEVVQLAATLDKAVVAKAIAAGRALVANAIKP